MTYPWLRSASARLANSAGGDRAAHALLLCGPAGLGKRDLALREAAALLCLRQSRPACGTCRSCQLMASGAHPDFRSITFGLNDKGVLRKEIVVDQVRELIASLQLTHTLSPRKVALIHPAEAMNRNAANALLKTLEEPAGDVVLLLVANDAARLPATVRSRCQAIAVRLPETAEAGAWLTGDRGMDPGEAALALEAAAGSPLSAVELQSAGGLEDYRMVRESLDRTEREPGGALAAYEALARLEPVQCWRWLSLAVAVRARRAGDAGAARDPLRLRGMLALQGEADRNRRLASTPVRHDLLLRDWLVQWAALAGTGTD